MQLNSIFPKAPTGHSHPLHAVIGQLVGPLSSSLFICYRTICNTFVVSPWAQQYGWDWKGAPLSQHLNLKSSIVATQIRYKHFWFQVFVHFYSRITQPWNFRKSPLEPKRTSYTGWVVGRLAVTWKLNFIRKTDDFLSIQNLPVWVMKAIKWFLEHWCWEKCPDALQATVRRLCVCLCVFTQRTTGAKIIPGTTYQAEWRNLAWHSNSRFLQWSCRGYQLYYLLFTLLLLCYHHHSSGSIIMKIISMLFVPSKPVWTSYVALSAARGYSAPHGCEYGEKRLNVKTRQKDL